MEHTPSPEAERNIKTAAELIRKGDDPEAILRFLYASAYCDGSLAMARAASEQLTAALKAAA